MNTIAMCLALLLAPSLHAQDNAAPTDRRADAAPACAVLLQEFLNVEPNREYYFEGRSGGGQCHVHLRRSQYINGITHMPTQEFVVGARAGRSYAAFFLSDSDATDEFPIELCERRGDQLLLAFQQRQRFGWRKTFSYRATLRRSGDRFSGARVWEEKDGVSDEADCALD